MEQAVLVARQLKALDMLRGLLDMVPHTAQSVNDNEHNRRIYERVYLEG